MYKHWQIKFVSLVILNVSSMVLASLAICFYISTKDYKKSSHIGSFNLLTVCMIQSLTTLPLYGTRFLVTQQDGVRDAFLFMYFLTQNGITFSLLIMSMDRVVSLWKPLLYQTLMCKSNTLKFLLACWIFCIIYDVIPFIHDCNKDVLHYKPNAYWSVAYHFMTNIISFFALLACWLYIVHIAIYHHRKYSKHQAGKANANSSSKTQIIKLKATRLTITILASYFVLYGPACFYYSLKAICLEKCFPENYNNTVLDVELRFIWKYQALLFTPVSTLILCWKKRFFTFVKEKIFKVFHFEKVIGKKRTMRIDNTVDAVKSTGQLQTQ